MLDYYVKKLWYDGKYLLPRLMFYENQSLPNIETSEEYLDNLLLNFETYMLKITLYKFHWVH